MPKKEPKIKIFVSHHKPGYIYEDDVFVPIQVGKKNAKVDLGILGDDTGDNISDRNSNYAELTAQYWVWKNYDLSDVDYVGFCHYRRYFNFQHKFKIYKAIRVFKENKGLYKKLCSLFEYIFGYGENIKFSKTEIKRFGENSLDFIKENNGNIYLGKRNFDILSDCYSLHHLGLRNEKLRNILKMIIISQYPEYGDSLDRIQSFRRGNWCNMFIMDKQTFSEYNERLFSILFYFEKQLNKDKLWELCFGEKITAGTRFLGCVAERLLNLFLEEKIKSGLFVYRVASNVFIEQ